MRNSIIHGSVGHLRLKPFHNRFIYQLYWVCVNVKELCGGKLDNWLFSYNKPRGLSILSKDYLGLQPKSISEKLHELLQQEMLADQVKETFLITCPRFLGYTFNPVSFFYCLDGFRKLVAIVVQINNTYQETHLYILKNIAADEQEDFIFTQEKNFFVSPFNTLEGKYQFRFSPLHLEQFRIYISLFIKEQPVIKTWFKGSFYDFNQQQLCKAIIRCPIYPLLPKFRIFYQALKLRLRGLKDVMKPNPMSKYTITINCKKKGDCK